MKFRSVAGFAPQGVGLSLSPFIDYLIEKVGKGYFLESLSSSMFGFYVVFSSLAHPRLLALRSTVEGVPEDV